MGITQDEILADIYNGRWVGMVECDISVPDYLKDYFVKLQLVFQNIDIVSHGRFCFTILRRGGLLGDTIGSRSEYDCSETDQQN